MVNISNETRAEADARLRRLMPRVAFKVYDDVFTWEEFALDRFPSGVSQDALALVRDDHGWSQLVPANSGAGERFKLFRFHFPNDADNSGFVGWLASLLKEKFGTGVFVTCGYSSDSGGIYDYWGCPLELGDDVAAEVHGLMSGGAREPVRKGGAS